MSLLIAFKMFYLKIFFSFLNKTKCYLCHLDFDYQEKYIDILCYGEVCTEEF